MLIETGPKKRVRRRRGNAALLAALKEIEKGSVRKREKTRSLHLRVGEGLLIELRDLSTRLEVNYSELIRRILQNFVNSMKLGAKND